MRERNVTRAAEAIHLSQPAMSHALKRLRSQLDDPILVRTTSGMQPTPRALEMEGRVRSVLNELENCLNPATDFNPGHSQKRFVISATNYFEVSVFPDLVARLRSSAPGVEIEIQLLRSDFPEQALEAGDIQLIAGVAEYLERNNRLRSTPLLKDSLTCVVGNGCSLPAGHRLSLEKYLSMTHVYPSPLGVRANLVESWLQEQGLSREIAATTQSYQAAAYIASKTDYALSLPYCLAEKMAPLYDLKILKPPPGFPMFQIDLIWHPLYENDPSLVWLKSEIVSTVASNNQMNMKNSF
jgi:DNA-binding transcriptional LysR family regulator